jgi:hypothetical protein
MGCRIVDEHIQRTVGIFLGNGRAGMRVPGTLQSVRHKPVIDAIEKEHFRLR